MSDFKDVNGEPSTANEYTLKHTLRKQCKCDGIVVSEYESVVEPCDWNWGGWQL